ncbi:MAG: hypothetical protein QMB59_06950, partial [Bacteroidales bacterium]
YAKVDVDTFAIDVDRTSRSKSELAMPGRRLAAKYACEMMASEKVGLLKSVPGHNTPVKPVQTLKLLYDFAGEVRAGNASSEVVCFPDFG